MKTWVVYANGEVRQRERARWFEENEDAIEGYNARVAAKGLFSDAWRKF